MEQGSVAVIAHARTRSARPRALRALHAGRESGRCAPRQPIDVLTAVQRRRSRTAVVNPEFLVLLMQAARYEIARRSAAERLLCACVAGLAPLLPLGLRRRRFAFLHRRLGGRLGGFVCRGAPPGRETLHFFASIGLPVRRQALPLKLNSRVPGVFSAHVPDVPAIPARRSPPDVAGGRVAIAFDTRFRIGPWEVQPRLGAITGPAGAVHLEPKVMGVLTCLAERAGEVVTRDQFVAQVWDGRIVSDEVLSRCISLLRTQLGDDPRQPRYIQTVPKIGYRLIAPVTPAPVDVGAAPANGVHGSAGGGLRAALHRRPLLAAAALLLPLLAVLGWYYGSARNVGTATPPSVVVLPFSNYSGSDDDDYFSDGLTEELINRLANVPDLQVVASTSAFAFKDRHIDVRGIADQLGVDYALTGSVRKESDRVRITAQLVDAARGINLWSQSFDTDLRDIFSVQDDIANGIVGELLPRLSGNGAAPVQRPTTDMAAYELLLRGRYQLKKREEAPIRLGIDLFRRALEFDPRLGEAYLETAQAYAILPTYSYEDPDEMFDLAEAFLERCVAMDPSMIDKVHGVRAYLHFARWEWLEAEEDFRRAMAATPNDPAVHQWYSQHMAAVGRPEASLAAVQRAKELDILSPVVNQRLAIAYLWVNDDERARRQFELANELGMGARANPEAFVVQLLRDGDHARAREILVDLQRLFARAPEWIDAFLAAQADSSQVPAARAALAQAAQERNISLKYLHGTLIYLGDADAALDVSFDLLAEPLEFEIEFLFARESAVLRRHARFGELVTAIGLDRYWERYGWPEFCARRDDGIVCH